MLFLLSTDVGFHVGGKTSIKYIVIQVHYVNPLPGTIQLLYTVTIHWFYIATSNYFYIKYLCKLHIHSSCY